MDVHLLAPANVWQFLIPTPFSVHQSYIDIAGQIKRHPKFGNWWFNILTRFHFFYFRIHSSIPSAHGAIAIPLDVDELKPLFIYGWVSTFGPPWNIPWFLLSGSPRSPTTINWDVSEPPSLINCKLHSLCFCKTNNDTSQIYPTLDRLQHTTTLTKPSLKPH